MLASILLSLKVAFLATLLSAIFGLIVAYFLTNAKFRGRSIVESLLLLPMILPPTVTGYYLVMLLGRHGFIGEAISNWTGWSVMFTWQAAVIAAATVSIPIMIRTAQSAMEAVDGEMVDSSTMLGRSKFETAWYIILPLAWPGILAGIVLTFTRAIGEFGATLMLAGNIPGRTDTMPLAIYSLATSGNWEEAHQLVMILTFISVIFLVLSRRIARRLI